MNRIPIVLGMAWVLVSTPARAGDAPAFALKDGDRVVLLGNTFVERDQEFGYLETLLTSRFPDRSITFRNLGWSGDTVFGEARARFGTPEDGFQHLKSHVLELKPTVIVVGYGMVESFEGEAGLPRFVEGLNRLLDTLAETKARIVLLSPIRHEDLGRPLPDPTAHNREIERYAEALRKAAAERGLDYVDLLGMLGPDGPLGHTRLTNDGVVPSPFGYWVFAGLIRRGLGLDPPPWRLEIGPGGKVVSAQGAKVSEVETTESGLRFHVTNAVLPSPSCPKPDLGSDAEALMTLRGDRRTLAVRGLKPGCRFVLKIDGRRVAEGTTEELAKGVTLSPQGAELKQVEALRATINAKNILYFHRWRPQNETYLYGFRKHEQGQNAAEVPRFDPLVDEKEAEIARLRRPVAQTYEVICEGEVTK